MDTLQVLKDLIKEKFGLAVDGIQPQTTLEDLGLDSLSLVELAWDLEERFRITLPLDVDQLKSTLTDLVNEVDRLRRAAAA